MKQSAAKKSRNARANYVTRSGVPSKPASSPPLLGDVNFFFLIDVAQEKQERAGAENDRQPERNPSIHVAAAGVRVGDELIKLVNRATQRSQTYN